jgi:hypothetical protein
MPLDQTTGTPGFTVTNPAGLGWEPDRNGCAGSALSLRNAYLTGDANVPAAVPTGSAPRSATAWVRCAPTTANSVVFQWGLNVNFQRSSLLAFLGSGATFVGYANDVVSAVSACTNAWMWLGYSLNGTHGMVFVNGNTVAVAVCVAVWVRVRLGNPF